ncbi:type I-E CRISPR-associated protein Cas6/Cse3/CasE [Corynebacterium bovis]|uniref:type I-E CRISPR-associated protein Cas6/Cse3/CasE n=1 Tax=Corynebacterium bovis TaxID=36808 RepID=UPI0031397592
MYLSRFTMNPQRRGSRELVANPQALHAAVMACWPDRGHDGDGRVLWRLDRVGHNHELYVVSRDAPSFDHLREQAGWSAEDTGVVRDYRPLLDRLEAGQRYRFRLTANPTHVVTDPDGRKRRLGHVTAAYQRAWLEDRCDRLGVSFPRLEPGEPTVVVTGREKVTFRRGRGRVTLQRATYDGLLEVTDPGALRSVLCEGLGRAKAYGCGLVTLAPAAPAGPGGDA